VVFHDATLECRTDGEGRTHKRDLAYLKALDIGYGYTADGGKTYPFRGQFIGAMPTLEEVITAFPDTYFMVNLKHGKASEGQAYLDYIINKGWHNLGLTASSKPAEVIRDARPEMIIQTRQNMKACLKGYGPIIWGWPHRFEKRLNAVGSRSMLMGAYEGHGSVGIDTVEQMQVIPKNYKGIVFTNKIEMVGQS